MQGYLDDPDATAGAIRDGWLSTGDIGWIGEDGNLRIVDRLKDMLVVGGFNVYPAEVEGVLLDHDGVAQAAVVSVPDERLGEIPVAFVVTGENSLLDAPTLIDHCRKQLANFKVPRSVWLVDQLPLNAVGKVAKAELRENAASRSQR